MSKRRQRRQEAEQAAREAAAIDPKRARRLGTLAAGAIALGLMLGTSPGLPLAWDEGNAAMRASQITQWARHVIAGELSPLDAKGIEQLWPYTVKVEGHPALYGVIIASGQWLTASLLAPLESLRFGPMMLFALATAALFWRLDKQYDLNTAIAGAAALLLLPRLFAHAHFASFDSPLTSCWILAWALFAPALRNSRLAALWGLALGAAMSCKATGWFAPFPFIVWVLLFQRTREAGRALLFGLPAAAIFFYLANPPLWHQPIAGFAEFLRMNSNRAFNVPTIFFGQRYDLNHPLPWYNTLVWVAITVPLPILALAVAGAVKAVRERGARPMGMLILLNAVVLLIVRALPIAPPHDATRLILPALPFVAALAGIGGGWVWARATEENAPTLRRRLAVGVLSLATLSCAFNLFWHRPQWLSYYSIAIGGLPGAEAAGMEPTYYWDGFDSDVIGWLNRHTVEPERVHLATYPPENIALMQVWGVVRFPTTSDLDDCRWYVLQRRPSMWKPHDRWLVENSKPSFRKTIRAGGWGPWRLNSPLVDVYSDQELKRAIEATKDAE